MKDLLLVLGGAEDRLQMVLGQPDEDGYILLASREWTVPGQSIKYLTPGIKETLDSFGLSAEAIGKVACVRGPGSFTGLRLVLAAAEGIAAANDLPVAGIDYLPLLAQGPSPLADGPLHVLTYARRGLVYVQSFDAATQEETLPLASLSIQDAADVILKQGDTATLMGSGLRKNPDFFQELAAQHPGLTLLDARWDNASPQLLLDVAASASYEKGSIEPIYARASDAEDNLPFIAQKRGLDPEKAKKRLHELQQS